LFGSRETARNKKIREEEEKTKKKNLSSSRRLTLSVSKVVSAFFSGNHFLA
jgi:hypothetical protein